MQLQGGETSVRGCSIFCVFFNLLDEHRKIGMSETHLWCRDTVVFRVGWYVFMMGKCGSQGRIVRMWEVIIPIQLFLCAVNLIPIRRD
jgi:hypothetical protein